MQELDRIKAQIKAAAYALAALVGYGRAAEILRDIAKTIESEDWQGPGNR